MSRHIFVSLLLAPLVLACGGGGSGDGGASAEITDQNALTIASEVLHGILRTADLSTIGGVLLEDAFPSAASATAAAQDAPLRGLDTALRALRAAPMEPTPSLPGGALAPSARFDPITVDCELDGTVTLSGNVAANDPTAGDHITARFDHCVNEDGGGMPLPELNGTLAYTIADLTGDPNALHSIVLALTFDAFSAETADEFEQLDGVATTVFNTTSPPVLLSEAKGAELTLQSGQGNDAVVRTLRGYDTLVSQDTEQEDFEIGGHGQLSSSEFTGDAQYDVTEVLRGAQDELPDEGDVLVTGKDSSMRIAVVDDVNVDLELDLDDDGVFPPEDTIHTTWAALGF